MLTIIGIGIGIGAVVALLGLAWGLQQSWTDGLKARKSDLVARKSSGGIMTQPFDQSVEEKVRQDPSVAATAGILGEVLSVEETPLMMISGREWNSFIWEAYTVVSGRLPESADEKVVVLGTIAAETLNKKVGDTVTLEVEELNVVGIVDGKALVENGCIIMSLPVLQQVMSKPGKINFVNIRLKPGADSPAVVAERLQSQLPGMRVDVAENVFTQMEGMKQLEAMNWGTSAIAILVGVFGVMNTMLMSVFERNREIGILIALGWKRRRVLWMILLESITLCAAAGVFGIVFGIVMVKILAASPWMEGLLEPYLGWDLVLFAFGLSLIVGLGSGLYPAFRCTKINPSMAIREP